MTAAGREAVLGREKRGRHDSGMSIATISAGGQLAIPPEYQQAMHLTEGGTVMRSMEGEKLIVQPQVCGRATLEEGAFGRPVLRAPGDTPPMTPSRVKAILEECP